MPLSPKATLAQLKQLGHEPNKKLGQNFLVDGNIVRKSLELAQVQPADRIVEIGPGLGTLTQALLETGAEVWAIEYDRRLHAHLETELQCNRLHLHQGDAVDEPLAHCPGTDPFKVVANLPYAIATPWLERVLAGPLPTCLILMLQKECADRFCATHGTRQYGAISVFLEAAYVREPGHAVARQCFYPIPDVDSVLLHLKRKPQPLAFSQVTRQCIRGLFTQRRKQIGGLVKQHLSKHPQLSHWLDSLSQLGIDRKTRPQSIPLEGWLSLEAHLQKRA